MAVHDSYAVTESDKEILSLCLSLSKDVIAQPNLKSTLQEVKGALYDKDYSRAFGNDLFLRAYFARYVPARALIFSRIFAEHLVPGFSDVDGKIQLVCIGGGAGSEILGIMACASAVSSKDLEITTLDRSDWTCVLRPLSDALAASNSTKNLQLDFKCSDCLEGLSFRNSIKATGNYRRAFTLAFVLTELLIQSRAKTIAMLANISAETSSDDLLVIIESANLGQIEIGSNSYSLGTLLDHLMLKVGEEWQIIHSIDSVWYRLPEGIAKFYPLKLENARVLLRIYKHK